MKDFLHKLWHSPLKGSLIALLGVVTTLSVNHLAGASGVLSLPAKTAVDILTLWGGSLLAVGGVAYSYFQESQKLKAEHFEERRTHKSIDFRRGKRTGHRWMPFCPKCEMPAEFRMFSHHSSSRAMACTAGCGWRTFCQDSLDTLVAELEARP